MELVSTNPTKPTCSNVSNKRLFIFFLSVFVYYRCVWWCAGRQRERGREKRRKTVKNERKRGEMRETKKRRDRNRDQSMIQAAWVLIAGFYCRVCKLRDRYRWILLRLPPFRVSRLFFCFYTQFVPYRVWKQRSTTVTWSYKHVRRNEKCRLA